jgi:hypothetical protein
MTKTMAEHRRRANYRSRRAEARILAARARDACMVLTNGDKEQSTKTYHRVLWTELSRLLNINKESTP